MCQIILLDLDALYNSTSDFQERSPLLMRKPSLRSEPGQMTFYHVICVINARGVLYLAKLMGGNVVYGSDNDDNRFQSEIVKTTAERDRPIAARIGVYLPSSDDPVTRALVRSSRLLHIVQEARRPPVTLFFTPRFSLYLSFVPPHCDKCRSWKSLPGSFLRSHHRRRDEIGPQSGIKIPRRDATRPRATVVTYPSRRARGPFLEHETPRGQFPKPSTLQVRFSSV